MRPLIRGRFCIYCQKKYRSAERFAINCAVMKIRFENSMPLAADYLNAFGSAEGFESGSLTPEDLVDVDVLAVRSTTKVDADLLNCANRLALVATATAGYNHIDTGYLKQQGIAWTSAAGCNAQAVAEYVLSVLANAHLSGKLNLRTATIGIVGAGNVGTALSILLDAISVKYQLFDPPLEETGDSRTFADWQSILSCDVITLHVPLVKGDYFPTENMINAAALSQLGKSQLLINACRGEVIDESALKTRLMQPDAPTVVLDVFYNEPNIDTDLLSLIWLATPHIAGHTVEGKLLGTQRVYESVCELSGKTPELTLDDFIASPQAITLQDNDKWLSCSLLPVLKAILSVYDIRDDDHHFRKGLSDGVAFTHMRKNYRVRRELAGHQIVAGFSLHAETLDMLKKLGMRVHSV